MKDSVTLGPTKDGGHPQPKLPVAAILCNVTPTCSLADGLDVILKINVNDVSSLVSCCVDKNEMPR